MISRIALQATTSSGKKSSWRDDDSIYTGDILLRFRHKPSGVHATVEGTFFRSKINVKLLKQGLQQGLFQEGARGRGIFPLRNWFVPHRNLFSSL